MGKENWWSARVRYQYIRTIFFLARFQLYLHVDFWGRNDSCGFPSALVEHHCVAFSAYTSVLGYSLCFLLLV